MSLNRWAVKRDESEPSIIDALEKAGWHVWQLDRPCDLLCWKPELGPGNFKVLEVKTPSGKKGRARKRGDQEAQQNFISTTGTPVVLTPLGALRAVGTIA